MDEYSGVYQDRGLDAVVMLIDDQAIVADMVKRAIRGEPDINFHYCQDPTSALREAEKIRPTVILLDLVMPEMDGMTLLRFLRANPATHDVPIIVLSTREEADTKAAAFALGAYDYVVKLPERPELLARIRHHSAAYVHKLQRDDAFRALRASQEALEEKNLELLRLSEIDGLTGLANRRLFDSRLAEEWRRSRRTGRPLGLAMFDVDWFKKYNDAYGHLEGDDCLREVARVLRESVRRPSDMAARYGGEEFVVLLPETDLGGARRVAEWVRGKVEALKLEHRESPGGGYVTVSGGVAARASVGKEPPEVLVEAADQALYRAKKAGRNRIEEDGSTPATNPGDGAESISEGRE
ncbi:MAG: diguanylate cyclase domain-containing protein [Phycisphaeraceae bacterium]